VPTEAQLREAQYVLGSGERLVEVLHPHIFSFFRYFDVGVALLIWDALLAYLLYLGPLEGLHTTDSAGAFTPMLPILIWAALATLLGTVAVVRFRGAFRFLYWFAVLVGIVLGALMTFVYGTGEVAAAFAVAYGLLVAIVALFAAEVFRKAFSYYITDLRVVLRYKLFAAKETDLRFEKIEDWKITRSFIWRMLGIGTIRPYTGTEDGKFDPNRAFDSPDECLFGIKDPERVRRDLVDLILSHDRARYGAVPEPAPAPTSRRPEPAPSISYYQPAPADAPAKATARAPPRTQRNYERVTPATAARAPRREEEQATVTDEEEGDEGDRHEEAGEDTGEEPEEARTPHPARRSAQAPPARAPPPVPEEDDSIDPAAGAYRSPTTDRQPRRMFPQASEGRLEPQLVEHREMRFEAGDEEYGERPRGKKSQGRAEEDLKPRGL
jgi:hypothetical protein